MDFKLSEAGLGAVEERFELELGKVIENVIDPNTNPDKKRQIIIKFEFEPNKNDRKFCELTTSVESKLAPLTPLTSGVAMGINEQTGEMNARENVQRSLFDEYPDKGESAVEEADRVAREDVGEGNRVVPFGKQASK